MGGNQETGQNKLRSKIKSGMEKPIRPTGNVLPCEPFVLTPNRELQLLAYAAPMARRCWKHSLQKTGRP
jgi:hypothetical protein